MALQEKYLKGEIAPDEVLIDAKNLPSYDVDRMEGKLERPIGKFSLIAVALFFALVLFVFSGKAWALQVRDGDLYEDKSENNRFKETVIIAERGVITDRREELLAWNIPNINNDFPLRKYIDEPGFGHVLGYVTYPLKDSAGFYYEPHFVGKDGVEGIFDETLAGENGLQIIETNALGKVESASVLRLPQNGSTLTLSIDARVQSAFYGYVRDLARDAGFTGGAGAIMDIKTGELLSLVSYPEYNPQTLTNATDTQAIKEYGLSKGKPYLNRAVAGVYTPGSIVKPFLAAGALTEKIIDPSTKILSTGSISIPNPYDPTKKSIFNDWKAHGLVDMRQALAVSSNVYFFEVGGGYEDQRGLGIANIEKYLRLFGFGSETGIDFKEEEVGTIPNPAWKASTFDGEIWRIGDTYNTAIGQYGTQVTPIQAVRATAAIANKGTLIKPTILSRGESDAGGEKIPIAQENFQIIQEGMRKAVLEGTASGLNIGSVDIAAKTGTAEIGAGKLAENSWVIGYFPYENPRYAFALVMESRPRGSLLGGVYVMRQLFDWMTIYTPEYLQ